MWRHQPRSQTHRSAGSWPRPARCFAPSRRTSAASSATRTSRSSASWRRCAKRCESRGGAWLRSPRPPRSNAASKRRSAARRPSNYAGRLAKTGRPRRLRRGTARSDPCPSSRDMPRCQTRVVEMPANGRSAIAWRHPSRCQTQRSGRGSCSRAPRRSYSTVTVFARFRGWSTFKPRRRAIRYASSWSGTTASAAWRNAGERGT